MTYVGLCHIFQMNEFNAFRTALNVAAEPSGDKFMIHLVDASIGAMAMGFISRDEAAHLRDALAASLASTKQGPEVGDQVEVKKAAFVGEWPPHEVWVKATVFVGVRSDGSIGVAYSDGKREMVEKGKWR